MKTPLILLFFYLTLQLNANELQWVDNEIKAIQPARVGLESKSLLKLKDPFLFIKLQKTAKEKSKKATRIYHSTHHKKNASLKRLHLSMTMNQSAKINGKWYKIGETVHGYKIVTIKLSKVTLSRNKKNYLLSTESKHKNLNFKH